MHVLTPVDDTNVNSVAREVTNLTSDHSLLKPEDINLAVNVIETVIQGGYSDNEVTLRADL